MLFTGLDFALDDGGALLIVGPNGSGKTSLLRLLAGFGRFVAGAVTWAGRLIADDLDAHRTRLHYVGHQEGLKPGLTVIETLCFWQSMAGSAACADPGDVLERHGLAALGSLPCRFLSAGQRRRLALARLDAWPAAIWLLDEPAVGLDNAALQGFVDRANAHLQTGGMILMSTHQSIPIEGATSLDLSAFPPTVAEDGGW